MLEIFIIYSACAKLSALAKQHGRSGAPYGILFALAYVGSLIVGAMIGAGALHIHPVAGAYLFAIPAALITYFALRSSISRSPLVPPAGAIGITIDRQIVHSLADGGSAAHAGVAVGDKILSANGELLNGDNTHDRDLMNAKPGTAVILDILRGKQNIMIKIRRERTSLAPAQRPPLPIQQPTLPPPAPFKFSCPQCGQHISTTTDSVGTQGACPSCGSGLVGPPPGVS